MLCVHVQASIHGGFARSFPLYLQRLADRVTGVPHERAGKHILPGLQLLPVGHEQFLSPYKVEF